jgi:HEPN domain-containing protein
VDTKEKFEYWLDIAQYDLETANTMFNGGRWLYVVFMCQQAVEKLVKGLYTLYVDDNVPRVHNITAIVEKFEDRLQTPVPQDKYRLFDNLSAYYLNNRYPDFLSKLSSQINEKESKDILRETKAVFAWLLTLKI